MNNTENKSNIKLEIERKKGDEYTKIRIPERLVTTSINNKTGTKFSTIYLPKLFKLGDRDISGYSFTTFPAQKTESEYYVDITVKNDFEFTLKPTDEDMKKYNNDTQIKITGKHLGYLFEEQNERYRELNNNINFKIGEMMISKTNKENIMQVKIPNGIKYNNIDLSGFTFVVLKSDISKLPNKVCSISIKDNNYYTLIKKDEKNNELKYKIKGIDVKTLIDNAYNNFVKNNDKNRE